MFIRLKFPLRNSSIFVTILARYFISLTMDSCRTYISVGLARNDRRRDGETGCNKTRSLLDWRKKIPAMETSEEVVSVWRSLRLEGLIIEPEGYRTYAYIRPMFVTNLGKSHLKEAISICASKLSMRLAWSYSPRPSFDCQPFWRHNRFSYLMAIRNLNSRLCFGESHKLSISPNR